MGPAPSIRDLREKLQYRRKIEPRSQTRRRPRGSSRNSRREKSDDQQTGSGSPPKLWASMAAMREEPAGRVFCPACTAVNGYQGWDYETELKSIIFEANEALHAFYRRREAAAATDDDIVVINTSTTDQIFTEAEDEAAGVDESNDQGYVESKEEVQEIEVVFN